MGHVRKDTQWTLGDTAFVPHRFPCGKGCYHWRGVTDSTDEEGAPRIPREGSSEGRETHKGLRGRNWKNKKKTRRGSLLKTYEEVC